MNDSNIHEQFWRLPAYRWLNRVFLAESQRFELWIDQYSLYLISSQALSTTQTTLQVVTMAESRGFEPLEHLRVLLFSRQVQLAALPTLRITVHNRQKWLHFVPVSMVFGLLSNLSFTSHITFTVYVANENCCPWL